MKENIPILTEVFDDFTLEYYEWLTQKEEDEYMSMLAGDQAIIGGDNTMVLKYGDLVKSRDYLITSLCKNLTLEQYGNMKPSLRKKISDFLQGRLGELKKK